MHIMTQPVESWYIQSVFSNNITRDRVTEQARYDYYPPVERGAERGLGALA